MRVFPKPVGPSVMLEMSERRWGMRFSRSPMCANGRFGRSIGTTGMYRQGSPGISDYHLAAEPEKRLRSIHQNHVSDHPEVPSRIVIRSTEPNFRATGLDCTSWIHYLDGNKIWDGHLHYRRGTVSIFTAAYSSKGSIAGNYGSPQVAPTSAGPTLLTKPLVSQCSRQGSNLQPSASEADALSNCATGTNRQIVVFGPGSVHRCPHARRSPGCATL